MCKSGIINKQYDEMVAANHQGRGDLTLTPLAD